MEWAGPLVHLTEHHLNKLASRSRSMSDPKSPFLGCPAGGSIGPLLAHGRLLSSVL